MSYLAFKNPAIRAKSPPAIIPTSNRRGIMIMAGSPRGASISPTTTVAVPPMSICPHPPILKNFIIKGMVNAYVAKSRGMDFLIVSEKPNEDLKEVVKRVRRASITLKPIIATIIEITPRARITADP
jgi:hypothetical protein